jgi:REP element-mobilizing transposase RayT
MSTPTAISYHIVFSTKNRAPVLKRERREDLFRYTWGIIKNRHAHLYRVNGVEDHLHILSSLCIPPLASRTSSRISRLARRSGLRKTRCSAGSLTWQEGYAGFTCSKRDLDDLIEYIKGQEEHHRKTTFEEEYRKLLVDAGIEFDERDML